MTCSFLSVKTKLTGLLARTRVFIPLILISLFDFGPEKGQGFSRNELIILHLFKRHFNFCPRKYEDAAETAFAQKSEDGLDLVLGKCATSNRPLVNRIQEMKAQLRQRR